MQGFSFCIRSLFLSVFWQEHRPCPRETFARKICKIAWNWGLQPEALSASCLEDLADYAMKTFPEECDARFREQAIARVKFMQAYHAGRGQKAENQSSRIDLTKKRVFDKIKSSSARVDSRATKKNVLKTARY